MNDLQIYTPGAPDLETLKATAKARAQTASASGNAFVKNALIAGLSFLQVRRTILGRANGQAWGTPVSTDSPPWGESPHREESLCLTQMDAMPDESFDEWLVKFCPVPSGTCYRWMSAALGMICGAMGLESADFDSVPLTTTLDGREVLFVDLLIAETAALSKGARLLANQCTALIGNSTLREIAKLAPKEKTPPLSEDAASSLRETMFRFETDYLKESVIFGQKLLEACAGKTTLFPNLPNKKPFHGARFPEEGKFKWWAKKYLPQFNPGDAWAYALAAASYSQSYFGLEDVDYMPISIPNGESILLLSELMAGCRERRDGPYLGARLHLSWLTGTPHLRAQLQHIILRAKTGRLSRPEIIMEKILDEG